VDAFFGVLAPEGGSMLIVAARPPSWVLPVFVVAYIALLVALGWVILQGYRWLARAADRSRPRAFEGLAIRDAPARGLVGVVFHTYYGFLVFAIQTEHRFWAPPEDARLALWRLHLFNLTWGMFVHGPLVIPLLSLANYFVQKRSIRRQETG
jgi:hypothetical protein